MKVPCSNCNQRLEIPEELAGQTIECPACKASLTVPSLAAPPPATPQIQVTTPSERITTIHDVATSKKKTKKVSFSRTDPFYGSSRKHTLRYASSTNQLISRAPTSRAAPLGPLPLKKVKKWHTPRIRVSMVCDGAFC